MKWPKNIQVLFLIMGLFLLITSIKAEVPNMIEYQGRMTDDGGQPIDGAKLIKFKIYGSPTGNDSLWWSGFQAVQITKGLFNYDLGSHVTFPENLFTGGNPRYLGITVDTDAEIDPRTQLISVPYAINSESVEWTGIDNMPEDFADGIDDGIDQPTADDLYLNADGDVLTGNLYGENSTAYNTIFLNPEMAYLSLRSRTSGTETVLLDGGLEGGLALKSSNGVAQVNLSANASRGLMQLFNNGTKTVEFDVSKASPDDQVALPEGSISPQETSLEAGVATIVNRPEVQLGTVYGPVDSISVDIPGDGVVIVAATGSMRLEPAASTEFLKCSISQSSTTEAPNCFYYYRIPNFVTGQAFYQPLSLTYVDIVSAGTLKYYLIGASDATFGGYIGRLVMTAVFYPTAYGDIEETE